MAFQKQPHLSTNPIRANRSLRGDEIRNLTSGDPGKVIPVGFVPLLREDSLQGSYTFAIEQSETEQMLLNNVNIKVQAHLVPFLAFDRFNGMDDLNRSYMGVPLKEGEEPVPFFALKEFGDGSNEIYSTLGLHAPATTQVNTAPMEAYNVLINFLRKNRSQKLPLRQLQDTTLADAFWDHTQKGYVVPDFDQAKIDGEIALNVTAGALPIRGIERQGADDFVYEAARLAGGQTNIRVGGAGPDEFIQFAMGPNGDGIYAEMIENGITVSLSNIEVAKKTRAFAEARAKYAGHDDEYIKDLLMQGIHIPDQMLKQPILLASQRRIMNNSQRYATDAENLDKSATNGAAMIQFNVNVPPLNTGGIVIFTVSITPEQLFERQADNFFFQTETTTLPRYELNYLDPEKVDRVLNQEIDTNHGQPLGTFGYAPMNHGWNRTAPRVGGKFIRPEVDQPFDEDRQRIWSVETPDPSLAEDFYLCRNMHKKPFMDTLAHPYTIVMQGASRISGLTVFGNYLQEASDDYDEIMSQIDFTRLSKDIEPSGEKEEVEEEFEDLDETDEETGEE